MNDELVRRKGRLLTISVDPPELSQRVISANKLAFPILSDPRGEVVRRYGLLHSGGGPGGNDIAKPAMMLVAPDGRVLWRFQSPRVQERARVADVLEAVTRAN